MYSPFYKAAHMYSNLYTVKYSNQCCLYIECFMHSLTIAPKSNNNLSTLPSGLGRVYMSRGRVVGVYRFCGVSFSPISTLPSHLSLVSPLLKPARANRREPRASPRPGTGVVRMEGGRSGCLSRVSVLSRPKLAFCVHIKV